MDLSIAKECGICTFEFDEDKKCPRILPCFDTLCSSCILEVIRNNDKKCPFCREPFQGQRVNDFRVNNNALDMLKYIRDLESKSPGIEDLKSQIAQICNTNISYSLKVESELRMKIEANSELKSSLDNTSSLLQNEVILKARATISTNKRHVIRLVLENEKMSKELETHEKERRQIENLQKKITSIRTFGEAGLLLDNAKQIQSQFSKCKQSFQFLIESQEQLHQGLLKNVLAIDERISVIKEMLESYEQDVEKVGTIDPYLNLASLTIQEDTRRQLPMKSLMDRSGSIRQLIDKQQIFAVQELLGKTRHAKLSVSNNKYVCIHHLSEETVAPDSVIFQLDEAMELLDPMSRTCFLELKAVSTGRVLGKLMIRLTHDTKSAKNFELLCTGQLGPSYSNTKIINVCDVGSTNERIWCGDYDQGNGKGGKSLVPGTGRENGGVLVQQHNPGLVIRASDSDSKASQFNIFTNGDPDERWNWSFGFVNDGLDILTGAINHYPCLWNEVVISDCGIVLMTL